MKAKERLRKQLLKHLKGAKYQPQNSSELARALGTQSKERKLLRAVLTELEADGRLKQLKKGRFALRKKGIASSAGGGDVIGTIRFQDQGHAFVADESQGENSRWILIPAKHTGTAMDRDRVSVALDRAPAEKPWLKHIKDPERRRRASAGADRPQGRVVKVLERRNSNVVGTFRSRKKFAYVQPDGATLPPTIELKRGDLPDPPPQDGEKVVVSIDSWDSREASPHGRIVRVLGPPDSPGVDILSIVHKHNLPLEFPDEVEAEVADIPNTVAKADIDGREDWRDRPVFTIDPKDAKDFDDAILVEPLESGGWELAVHIADVSHYVTPRSALDREAEARGNSVYLVDRVIPMLPEKLSNGLCSLKPDVDRLTRAAIMRFDENGIQTDVRFVSAVIRSQKRYTYEQAFDILKTEGGDDPMAGRVRTAWELASLLRKRRFENGGLDLDFPEVKVELNKQGHPVDLVRIDYDESHQLIEEFMLAANEAVAKVTKDRLAPSIYRIHEDPDPDKLNELRETVSTYGIRVGDLSNRGEVQKLLDQADGMHEEHAIKIALLRSLKRAAYSESPIGHYGLAKVNYTHFTSPIRRYADLIVHRVLGRLMEPADGKKFKTPKLAKIKDIAAHLSIVERTAAEAEKETRRLKELEYFASLAARKSGSPVFRATVIDVRRMGVFIELSDYYIGGLIRLADLPPSDEGGYFDPGANAFFSRSPNWRIGVGDDLEVTVARVDIEQGFLDFRVLGSTGMGKGRKGKTRAKKSTARRKSSTRSKSARGRGGRGKTSSGAAKKTPARKKTPAGEKPSTRENAPARKQTSGRRKSQKKRGGRR